MLHLAVPISSITASNITTVGLTPEPLLVFLYYYYNLANCFASGGLSLSLRNPECRASLHDRRGNDIGNEAEVKSDAFHYATQSVYEPSTHI